MMNHGNVDKRCRSRGNNPGEQRPIIWRDIAVCMSGQANYEMD